MVNMWAAANLHQSRIPAPAAVCVYAFVSRQRRSRGSARSFSSLLADFFCSYVGQSDSQSVLVRIEVVWDEGSGVCVIAANGLVAARRLCAT